MSATELSSPAYMSRSASWPVAGTFLGVGLAFLLLLFAEEVKAAVQTWENSTAYNHCWLVLPVAGWLAWSRRRRVSELWPAPAPVAALGMVLAGMAWLVAERL